MLPARESCSMTARIRYFTATSFHAVFLPDEDWCPFSMMEELKTLLNSGLWWSSRSTLCQNRQQTKAKFQTAGKVRRISTNTCQEQVVFVRVTMIQEGNNYLTPRAKSANSALARQDLYQSPHTCPCRPHAPRRGLPLLLGKDITIHCEGDTEDSTQ